MAIYIRMKHHLPRLFSSVS